MSTQVVMPQLGESVVEGTVGKWFKQVGDKIEQYEPIMEVVTDKVTTEIPSPAAGCCAIPLADEYSAASEAAAAGLAIRPAGCASSDAAAKPGSESPTPRASAAARCPKAR